MRANYFDEYPGLRELFNKMRDSRRSEILEHLKSNDGEYAGIVRKRAEQSMILRRRLKEEAEDFEKYMDLVYSQELYELDAIYEHAFIDALDALKRLAVI